MRAPVRNKLPRDGINTSLPIHPHMHLYTELPSVGTLSIECIDPIPKDLQERVELRKMDECVS